MTSSIVPPPVGSGDLPQLFRLPGLKFQGLCRDLLDGEPGVTQCHEFGANGQAQYGIDLILYLTSHGIDVAQCKAVEDFTPKKIREASDEFLKNWDYWKGRDVRRFLVLVGSGINHTKCQEEIIKQKARFREFGLDYELWSASTIVNKLRPHRGIVAQHLDQGWVRTICGETGDPTLSLALAGQTALNERLVVAMGTATDERLAGMKEAWQSGRRTDARKLLANTKGDRAVWLALPPTTKANILRFEASISLDAGVGTESVAALLDEAARFAPDGDDLRLRAALLWHEGDRQGAIDKLSDVKDESALALKAVMLLSSGRLQEAEAALKCAGNDNRTAEYFRTEALCNFAGLRMAEARLSIKKAEERAPLSLNISLTAGAIEYFSALVAPKIPPLIPSWPEPVHWNFILRTDEATGRLRSAADRFRKALQIADLVPEERQNIEAWYIASLANLPEDEEFAQAELIALINPNPINHRLIVWASARFPSLKIDRSVSALRTTIIDNKASAEQVTALVHRYALNRQWKKAWSVLSKARPLFSNANAESIWGLWAAQLKAAIGQDHEAEQIAQLYSLSESERRLLKVRALRQKNSPEAIKQLCEHLNDSFVATNDPQFLLEAVELKAQSGDWPYVAERAEALSKTIPTAEVIGLCALGLFNAHQFRLCLNLLDKNEGAFAGSRLPAELRRIRVHCKHALGLTPIAIQEAVALANERPTVDNLLSLNQLYFSMGDYRQHASTAERLAAAEPLTTPVLLRLAWQVKWEDRELAVRLWRRAARGTLRDDDVVPALQLGYALGLDEELRPITDRMTQLGNAGKAGVQIASFDDIKRFAVEFKERAQACGEAYDRGRVPIHTIATLLNLTLAEIFHEQPSKTADASFVWSQPCIWARHARRPLPEILPAPPPDWRLTADATAFLVANHFGFIDAVEKSFRPIRISPGLIPSLVLMQDRLTANQPHKIEACNVLLQLIEKGRVSVMDEHPLGDLASTENLGQDWLSLAEDATRQDGFIVDFMPLRKADGTELPLDSLPAALRGRVIGQKAVLAALLKHGPLVQSQFDDLCERLGSIGAEPVEFVPEPGSGLYFAGTAIETLAGVGILPQLSERFRVFVSRQQCDRVKSDIKVIEERAGLAVWVKALVKRVSASIESGDYELLPVHIPTDTDSDHDLQSENADLASLKPILQAHATERDRFWADDRWLNSHARAGGMETIDSVGVLAGLVAHGSIQQERYFELLGTMRAEGFHFIPLAAEEIIRSLRNAHVGDTGVVETQALVNLRRGVAAGLLRARVLQRPATPVSAAEFGELAFLIQYLRVFAEALSLLWAIRL